MIGTAITDSTAIARLAGRKRAEEQPGLQLAVQGHLMVVAVLGVFSVAAFNEALLVNTLAYITAFAPLLASRRPRR